MYGYKICIRWKRNETKARLQIKTIFKYGENVQIRYHVTGLLSSEPI